MDMWIAVILIAVLLGALASGLWIGVGLLGVAIFAMEVFTSRPAGDSMALTVWGHMSSWTLTALPLFLWMGEILFRSKLSEDLFKGLAPWLERLPGGLLHVNILGCTLFAAVSGSSAATCATVGKIALPELQKRGYPEGITLGTLAGAGTLGLLIPPSIIMIVYGVAANVSIAKLFVAGVLPGLMLAALFMGYVIVWSWLHPGAIPKATESTTFLEKIYASRRLIPVILLIAFVLGSIYSGIATATEAAAFGVAGSLFLAKIEGSLSWKVFREGIFGATRMYCMIGMILAGAAFLTLAMGFIGLPRHLAEYVGTLNLSPLMLIVALTAFFIIVGTCLDGISVVVLTMAVLLPTVERAGIDLLWFGIFVIVTVEMAQITPPVGFNLFVLQGLAKREITYLAMKALPMFLLMVLAVFLLYFFPQIVLYLPSMM